MTRGFRRTPAGITARFDPMQAGVLRRLAADVEELMTRRESEQDDGQQPPSDDPLEALLGDLGTAASTLPYDPVLARLLPDGYADDASPDARPIDGSTDSDPAADFRRFTEGDLRAGKTAHAQLLRETLPQRGGDVLLDEEQSAAWLGCLNDIRLSLGTALEVGPEAEQEYLRLDPMSSRARRLYLYFWLGVLQETLVEAITDAD